MTTGIEIVLIGLLTEVVKLAGQGGLFGGAARAEKIDTLIRTKLMAAGDALIDGADCQKKCFEVILHVRTVQKVLKAIRDDRLKEVSPGDLDRQIESGAQPPIQALTSCLKDMKTILPSLGEGVGNQAIALRDLGVRLDGARMTARASELVSSVSNIEDAALKLVKTITDKTKESGQAL